MISIISEASLRSWRPAAGGWRCESVREPARPGARALPRYTQFAIRDSRLFGPNPWKVSAPPSNYLPKRVSGQPNPWNKSWTANSCYANWVYIHGLTSGRARHACAPSPDPWKRRGSGKKATSKSLESYPELTFKLLLWVGSRFSDTIANRPPKYGVHYCYYYY